MIRLILGLIFFSFSSMAIAAQANLSGKTLNQFFVMASDHFEKPVIAHPTVDGKVTLYGISQSDDFQSLFYSVMEMYGYVVKDNGRFIEVKRGKTSTVNSKDRLIDHLVKQVDGVFITGAVGIHDQLSVKYVYSFADADGRIFKPGDIGLTVKQFSHCHALLTLESFEHFVTCNPYQKPLQPEQHRRSLLDIDDNKTEKNRSKVEKKDS